MKMFQKLKRVPLSCLILLLLTEKTFAAIQSCDNKITENNGTCNVKEGLTVQSDQVCVLSEKIYKISSGGSTCGVLTSSAANFLISSNNEVKAMASTTSGILYKCGTDSKCTAITSGYILTADGSTTGTDEYLFSCNTSSCTKINPSSGYYLSSYESGKYKNIIKCTGNTSLTCDMSTMPTAGGTYYYMNAVESSKIIECTFTASKSTFDECKTIDGKKTKGYAYLNAGDSDKSVIAYLDNKYQITTGNPVAADDTAGTPVQNAAFLDASLDDSTKNVIICSNSGTVSCAKAAVNASSQGHAYLDGSCYDPTKKFTKLITCNASGVCTPGQTGSTTAGHAYVDAGSGSTSESTTYVNVITCTSENCSVVKGSTADGVVYIDAILNTNVLSYDTTNKIKSNSNGATGTARNFYIDGTDTTKIITCTSTKCERYSPNPTDKKYFPDTLKAGNVITCDKTSGCSSAAHNVSTGSKYYVDGYTDGVLECKSDGCKALDSVSNEPLTGYINFDGKTIIKCSASSTTRRSETTSSSTGCSAQPTVASGKTAYYINGSAKDEIITCSNDGTDVKCEIPTSGTKSVSDTATAYLNDGETMVIQCINDATANKVTCAATGPTTEKTKVNYIEATEKTKIITCEKGKVCKLTTDAALYSTNGYAYPDYVNAGYVIKCGQTNKCKSEKSEAVAENATAKTPLQTCNYIDGYDATQQTLLTCTPTACFETILENFPEGHAVLDCSQNDGTNTFKSIITIGNDSDSSKKLTLVSSSLKIYTGTGAGFAYIDNTDTNKKRIIGCTSASGPCSAINVEVKAAKDNEPEVNAFYINGRDDKKIIVCTSENGCISQDGSGKDSTVDSFYIDSANTNNVLICGASNAACQSASRGTVSTPSYFVDGYKAENILKCENAKICVEEKGVSSLGYGYIDSDTKNPGHVIVCKKGTGENANVECKSQGNGSTATPNQKTAFIDAATNQNTLLICSSPTAVCVSTPQTVYKDGEAFLDGSSLTTVNSEDKITNLIICKKEGDTGKCTAYSASNTNPKTEDGFVYIDSSSDNGSGNKLNIIQCTKSGSNITCESKVGPTTKEFGFIDATDNGTTITKIITCDGGCLSKSNSATAEAGKAPKDQFLINFIDQTKIIVCSKTNGCSSIPGNSATEGNKYYPDGLTPANIFICEPQPTATSGTGTPTTPKTCVTTSHAGSSTKAYYINGYNEKYVLECSTSDGCISSLNRATADQNSHYVDAGGEASKPVIITCSTEKCSSGPGDITEGVAYLDPVEPKNVIICTASTAACSQPNSGVASTSDTYIDAGDNAQIIHCNSTLCDYFPTKPGTFNSEYYPRLSSGVKEIIECDYDASSDKKSICKLDKENAVKPNLVYKNYLFGKTTSNTKPLIICDSSSCKPSDANVNEGSKGYYINSDNKSVNKTLSSDVIECTGANEECKILSSNTDADVYLNANFDATNNNKQVIICKTGEGCLEQKTNSTASDLRYYVNAGSTFKKSLNDTLIECKDTCEVLTTVKDGAIYVDEFDTSHTIQCYEDKGCVSIKSQATDKKNEIFLNSSDLSSTSNAKLTKDLIKCINTNSTITCSAQDGQPDEVYINSHNVTELIICTTADGCKTKASEALTTQPEFYVNADPTDEEKLDGDLIKCRNNGSKITCEVTKGNDGDVYLNANVENDAAKNPLIMCSNDMGCITDVSKATAGSLPAYYVNSGSVSVAKLNDTLIECTYDKAADCEIKQAAANDVYVNYANSTETHPLIKCNNNGCKVAISSATEKSNEYYLNAGDTDEKALDYDIIECSDDGETIECKELEKTGEGVYLNSNYSEKGDSNQLIFCSSDNGCEGIKTSEKKSEYYVNAEASDLTNAIIFCSNKKCEKQTPINIPTYYVGATQDGEVSGLIECNKVDVDTTSTATATATATTTATATATTTVAASRRRKRATQEICKLKSAFTSNGYFLNAGYNKAINQTIICDSSDGCETVKVDLGYYVNAGDDTKPIIKCDKEGSECASEESNNCPVVSDAVAGDYCYEEGLLKFFPEGNSTAIAASKSDDIYTFATIPSGGFPGIKSETGSLFKISRYFINRFYQSGIVMIDKNGKLVDNLSSSDQSDINLYDCNDSTKVCSVRPGCTSDAYMYDSENKKAVYCNAGKLEYAEFTGYVVDSNRVVGSNHPYIIYCENNGNKCSSLRPKVNSYYENSGFDSATNSLIECSNNNCVTKTADVGYYIGHEGAGIIQCTSTTSCTFTKTKSNVKYVNAGSSKSSKAIISCNKNGCSAIKANIGYYLTYTSTLLIQCTSPMSCVEFTPTVNYYDNADSTESSNTIINCVQSSQVVTCAPEATNNGFYMSSSPNVLIRCKSGNKCKAVKVKNGIFRGAIKALTGGGSKRTSEEDVELEEDGKRVAMPRDSDDSYDIIRCVQEKCTALSPSEVSAIPICEFNNNKCYITLDYAMTKSATTSISAGNICTNSDRSVFYFATDTVVVKPNVISGVTATYVYTTTNSNCLEVNDSYSDMYFTVGSNIYLLDQGSVLQFYEQGYYFINTAKNAIVNGNDIDAYNDENVKLYKCNGNSCSIMDKPDSLTYYADVNKRIIRYNVNSDSYSFAYEKDITCIFANNKCTPNADLKNQEFCITYKGELALATADIKNRETGECYKASTISSNIYGYSQYLYNMNMYSAQMVDETGYYIVSLSTNTTVVSKNYKTKNNNLVVYGCQLSSCKVIEPDENVYYYDSHAKTILRYKDGVWKTPDTSGYAYISIDPANTYIYRFTKNAEEVKINGMANYGYYYTVDGEMYNCDRDEDGDCAPIDNTGYYFTNAGEVYYCVHDSEEIEPTECTKQACVSGQYYSIDGAYYRCESSSTLIPVMSRYCSYNENVVINFPLALTEEFPDKIKQAVEGIEKNNNSTAIVSRRGKNYLESVSGIFTNCTYNVEETKSTFDLVCVNNYVTVDEETDDVKICSMEQLGYVECIEDEENPEKCNVSGAPLIIKPAFITLLALILSLLYYAL